MQVLYSIPALCLTPPLLVLLQIYSPTHSSTDQRTLKLEKEKKVQSTSNENKQGSYSRYFDIYIYIYIYPIQSTMEQILVRTRKTLHQGQTRLYAQPSILFHRRLIRDTQVLYSTSLGLQSRQVYPGFWTHNDSWVRYLYGLDIWSDSSRRHRSLVSPTDVPPPRSFSLPQVQPKFLGIFLTVNVTILHSRTETDNTLQYNTTRHQIMDQIEASMYSTSINTNILYFHLYVSRSYVPDSMMLSLLPPSLTLKRTSMG